MVNFFTDNQDLQFHLNHGDWREVVERKEQNFADAGQFADAPYDYQDTIDNYRRVLELMGEICGERIAPRASEVDEEGCHLEDGKVRYAAGVEAAIRELSQADLMGFTLPRRYGGLNLPTFLYNMAIEMISQADASLMTLFGLQDISETIYAFADEETSDKYLPKFCTGEVTGAMVLTEPDAGSDLQAVTLRATEDPENGCWRLNGVKRFISNGLWACASGFGPKRSQRGGTRFEHVYLRSRCNRKNPPPRKETRNQRLTDLRNAVYGYRSLPGR